MRACFATGLLARAGIRAAAATTTSTSATSAARPWTQTRAKFAFRQGREASVTRRTLATMAGADFAALRGDVEAFVREEMAGYDPSHDFEHVERVRRLALDLAKREEVEDLEVVELAALLHDVKDHKYAAEGEDAGPTIRKLLDGRFDASRIEQVVSTVENVSFSKQMKRKEPLEMTPELAVVQDADRLDAIGSIGIARCFAFGGARNRSLYTVRDNRIRVDGARDDESSFGHFYEKLVRIKDFLNTPSGKAEGATRHAMLESFMSQLVAETGLAPTK